MPPPVPPQCLLSVLPPFSIIFRFTFLGLVLKPLRSPGTSLPSLPDSDWPCLGELPLSFEPHTRKDGGKAKKSWARGYTTDGVSEVTGLQRVLPLFPPPVQGCSASGSLPVASCPSPLGMGLFLCTRQLWLPACRDAAVWPP